MAAKCQTAEEKLKLALQLQQEKEYGKSNKHLVDLYSTNDMKELVCLNLGKNYLAIGNMRMAAKYSQECISMMGNYSKEAAIVYGAVLHQENRVEEEEMLYRKMLAKFPGDYNLNLYQAMLFSELPNRARETGRCFLKTIECDPFNRAAHFLASQYELEHRHYIQCLLSEFFQLMISPGEQSVIKIQAVMKSARNLKDAMQEAIYSTDSTASETDIQLFWAMAFLGDMNRCELMDGSALQETDCFADNVRNLVVKTCESAMAMENREEWAHSDFYLDFFSKLLKNNFLEEFLYYTLIKAYPDIKYCTSGVSKESLLDFAKFLEGYFSKKAG